LKRSFIKALQALDYACVIKNSNIFHAIDFIKNVNMEGEKSTLNTIAIEQILKRFKRDSNFWQLALRASSFLEEKQIEKLIGKNWLNDFYIILKKSIDLLGNQLFGTSYPDFVELKRELKTSLENGDNSLESIQRSQRSFYMQRTDFDWYPNYIKVKQQVSVLKSCHPHGYRIYELIVGNFELLKRLEDHEKNRYNYKLKNKTWDMINGHQPKFMDPDEYARLEEDYYSNYGRKDKDEEE
jgi:hypothetical protein